MEKRVLSEKVKDKEDIQVVHSDFSMAHYDHKCSKCGFDKAELIEQGINYSDEDNVMKYKCGRCGHVDDVTEKAK